MFLKKLFPLAAALMLIFNSAQAQTVVKDAEKFAAISEQVANYMKPLASIVVKVKVDSAIVNGKNLDSYMADVDTDAAYEKDTEVIKDGYFHESEYRSAPYFDMFNDGITNLDK